MSCLQNFSTKEILNNHRKQSLLINGCQAVNYESGTKIKEGEHTTKYQEHYPNSIGAKLVYIDRFTLPTTIFKGKDCINKFIAWVNKNGQK